MKTYCNECYYYAPHLIDSEACMTGKIYHEIGITSPHWQFKNANEKNKNNDCPDFKQATWWSKLNNKLWCHSGVGGLI